MFTGIVQEIGIIKLKQKKTNAIYFSIDIKKLSSEIKIGDSIAINGVCLTVTSLEKNVIQVCAVNETLKKTSLQFLKQNENVNCELPLRFSDRIGGHFLLGHIDCIGNISLLKKITNSFIYKLDFPNEFLKYVIPHGSIGIDGISLTVAEKNQNSIFVSIIPHTFKNTIFNQYKINQKVNIEFDVLGKYILETLNRNL